MAVTGMFAASCFTAKPKGGIMPVKETNSIKHKTSSEVLVKNHYPLIHFIAARVKQRYLIPTGFDMDDLVNWGVEGLLQAKQSFCDKKNNTFSTYASFRIKGKMLDELRKEWRHTYLRRQIGHPLETVAEQGENESHLLNSQCQWDQYRLVGSFDYDSVTYESEDDLVDSCLSTGKGMGNPEQEWCCSDDIWAEINQLLPLEKQVLTYLFRDECTLARAAKQCGCSIANICRVREMALKKLKRRCIQKELV